MEDYLVRAIAANGQVRAFAAYTKNTVEAARQAHNTSPVGGTWQTSHSGSNDGKHDEGRQGCPYN